MQNVDTGSCQIAEVTLLSPWDIQGSAKGVQRADLTREYYFLFSNHRCSPYVPHFENWKTEHVFWLTGSTGLLKHHDQNQ
jgi:hypothetical protein